MIVNSTEENLRSKVEASPLDGKTSKASSSSTTTPWPRLKDPRIVRVSRAFGGKDRHSKVCTVRGLRDRRVRLSVSTAIELYDLQDRLGLNQPSKVVDWLLNAAKHEIDELPPLPIPSENLGLSYQSMLTNNESAGVSQTNQAKNEVDQKQVSKLNNHSTKSISQASSFSALLNNVTPFGYHREHSNLASPHNMGSHGFMTSQAGDHLHNFNLMSLPLPTPLSLSTGSSQIFLCPPGFTQSLEIDPRHVNHLQMMSSSSQNFLVNNSLTPPPHTLNQSLRPFHFSMAPKFVSPDKNNGDQPNKNNEFTSQ